MVLVLAACGLEKEADSGMEPPRFVEEKKCFTCHQGLFREWETSHHARAMSAASDSTVAGDFNNAVFKQFGVTSQFFKKDGKFYVYTEGHDGKMAVHEIKYTFGFYPLQQYLVEFPGGRLQCLTIAWDDVKKKWYSLYPDEKIQHDDWLHWTKGAYTWNGMCADCHSTNLQKNYDPVRDVFNTTWSHLNVTCQACHGPGSGHVQWAEGGKGSSGYSRTSGTESGIPAPLKNVTAELEIQQCARCHARRTRVKRDFRHDRLFLDQFTVQLLNENVYHPDGQIQDEVYVYGSFIQSKMYRKGVRCSDCHNSHTTKVRAEGNSLCTRCHEPDVYDVEKHFRHQQGSEGSLCVNCHMPGKVYMGIDFRRDHSLRIPRPDLSDELGTPNACNQCHEHKTASWAAGWVEKWHGPDRPPHFGKTLHRGRQGAPGADRELATLTADTSFPGIARATALLLLNRYGGDLPATMWMSESRNPDPLIRFGVLRAIDALPPNQRKLLAADLLRDSLASIRTEAARTLLEVEDNSFTSEQLPFKRGAVLEYLERLDINSDFPTGRVNNGMMYMILGQPAMAVSEYEKAIEMDNRLVPPRVNVARIYNQMGQNEKAREHLEKVVELEPRFGEGYYSLGLLLAEEKNLPEAVKNLKKAARLLPENPRIHYNLGLALQRMGKVIQAEKALLKTIALDTASPDFYNALTIFYTQQKKWKKAKNYGSRLLSLQPNDPNVKNLMAFIENEGRVKRKTPPQ